MGVAPFLLTSIQPTGKTMNTHEQNRYQVPLISSCLIASKSASANECDVAHERYHRYWNIFDLIAAAAPAPWEIFITQ